MAKSQVKIQSRLIPNWECGVAMLVGLVLLVHTAPVVAEIRAELPGLVGTYQEAELTGIVVVPDGGDAQEVYLEFSGSQVPGLSRTGYGSWPSGAEIHLYLEIGGVLTWLRCDGNLSPVSGEFVESLQCMPTVPDFWIAGPSQFWMFIGYDPDNVHMGSWYDPYPELTISTVHLVASQAVSTQASTWGSVKALFR